MLPTQENQDFVTGPVRSASASPTLAEWRCREFIADLHFEVWVSGKDRKGELGKDIQEAGVAITQAQA